MRQGGSVGPGEKQFSMNEQSGLSRFPDERELLAL
jgi:hypothetical protein